MSENIDQFLKDYQRNLVKSFNGSESFVAEDWVTERLSLVETLSGDRRNEALALEVATLVDVLSSREVLEVLEAQLGTVSKPYFEAYVLLRMNSDGTNTSPILSYIQATDPQKFYSLFKTLAQLLESFYTK